MTPTMEPGDRQPARLARLTAWTRKHPRLTGVGVIVSSLVLVGVAVVLGWTLLTDRPQVGLTDATPSATPAPTSEASASPSGSPDPTETTATSPSLDPGLAWPPVGTDPGPVRRYYMVWATVTVNELNVRSGPGEEDPSVGQLNAGDLVLAPYGPNPDGWAEVIADGVAGYVNGGPADDPYLLATKTPWNAHVTSLSGVASNGDAYVAFGPETSEDYLLVAGDASSLILRSTDGETWTQHDGPPGRVFAVAGGPNGFVASSGGHGGVMFTTFSPDGRTWEKAEVGGYAAVASGPGGWVATNGAGSVLGSSDGRTWGDSLLLNENVSADAIASSEAGYVVYGRGVPTAWASADGATWTPFQLADGLGITDIELSGNRVLVLATTADDHRTIVLRGILAASGAVTIDGSSPISIDDAGYGVHSITAGPEGILAVGWNLANLVPIAWTSVDGASWTRHDLEDGALGGSVTSQAVWGSGGWVTLERATQGAGGPTHPGSGRPGHAVDGAAQQLWRSSDGTSWMPTGDAVAYEGPKPPCPPPSQVNTLVLLYLGSFADACFGDTSLTVRGYVPVIDGVGGVAGLVPSRRGSRERSRAGTSVPPSVWT